MPSLPSLAIRTMWPAFFKVLVDQEKAKENEVQKGPDVDEVMNALDNILGGEEVPGDYIRGTLALCLLDNQPVQDVQLEMIRETAVA